MKRFLAIILALSLLLALTGCDLFSIEKADEEFDLEDCLDEVEDLVEEGELDEAERLLKKALRKTDDEDELEELEAWLEIVEELKDDGPKKETDNATTAPMDATEATQRPDDKAEQPHSNQKNLADTLDRNYLYKINVFLSNFAEQNFRAYPCSDYEMLMFGYMYAKVNNREVLENNSTHYYIAKSNMDSILNRFFNKTVSLSDDMVLTQNNYPVTFKDGAYYFPGADGASVSYCAVATGMFENSDGTYDVTFDVYGHKYPHESMSPYYELNAGEAKNCADLEYLYSGNAVVKDYVRSNGAESYQLISYSHS